MLPISDSSITQLYLAVGTSNLWICPLDLKVTCGHCHLVQFKHSVGITLLHTYKSNTNQLLLRRAKDLLITPGFCFINELDMTLLFDKIVLVGSIVGVVFCLVDVTELTNQTPGRLYQLAVVLFYLF